MSSTPGRGASRGLLVGLLASLALVTLWSIVRPHDYGIWFLEAGPVVVAVPLLLATYRRFPLTPVTYVAIWLHALVLLVGAHYTYELVPVGDWVKEALGLSRNHYDRLGHVAQGCFPALVAREVLVRTSPLRPGKWLFFLVTCFCLAFSAFYELVEWWVSLLYPEQGNAFLATQGDIWDTQWDMFLALCGAVAVQLLLSGVQDRQMAPRGAE